MGEKEQGVAGANQAGDEGAQSIGGASERASNLNLSKSNINRTATGDPDFDMAGASSVKSSKSNTSE